MTYSSMFFRFSLSVGTAAEDKVKKTVLPFGWENKILANFAGPTNLMPLQ